MIRRADAGDAAALTLLARAHARYERLPAPPADHSERLANLLSGPDAKIAAWIALAGRADGAGALGYASFTREYATLSGRAFGHLDCLFVVASVRGRGLGVRLFGVVLDHARGLGLTHLGWQTPSWNDGARRFYARLGAEGAEKVRYRRSTRTGQLPTQFSLTRWIVHPPSRRASLRRCCS